MKFQFNDGGRQAAGYKGDAGDCVTRSIAIATGIPYQEVYDMLSEGNATQRRSKKKLRFGNKHQKKSAAHGICTTRKWFKDYMASLGFTWKPTMLIGQGCKVHLKDGELPMGTIIVSVSKHMTTVVDGVIHDTHDPSRDGTRCVYGYYSKDK